MRVVVTGAAAAALLLSGCGSDGSDGSTPPPDASPSDVVTAYLEALNDHDKAAAEAVLAPHWRSIVEGEVDSPLTNTRSITDIKVGSVSKPTSIPGGRYEGWSLVSVAVTYTLDQYKEESMNDGVTRLSYELARADSDSPWRIVNAGEG